MITSEGSYTSRKTRKTTSVNVWKLNVWNPVSGWPTYAAISNISSKITGNCSAVSRILIWCRFVCVTVLINPKAH